MKLRDQINAIPDALILNFLADRQGEWTSLWMGYFKGRENEIHLGKPIGIVEDVYFAFPENTKEKIIRLKLKDLWKRNLIGGCPCGCRGDFEIRDEGLTLINRLRIKSYTGY